MALKGLTGVGISDWLSAIVQSSGKFLTAEKIMIASTKVLDDAFTAGKNYYRRICNY